MLFLGAISGSMFIVERWVEAERPPFVSTFEVLIFLSIVCGFLYLIFERIYKVVFIGPFATLLILVVALYATLFESSIQPLMPALRNSFWLTIHVIFCFIGYAGFFMSFVTAILHLASLGGKNKIGSAFITAFFLSGVIIIAIAILTIRRGLPSTLDLVFIIALILLLTFPLQRLIQFIFSEIRFREKEGVSPLLENVVYKSIMFGFPFLSAGIITGSIWANEAWGRYWYWDPKETWSLITWLIYFVYIHLRFMRGWRGAKLSWFSILGFFAMLFTFFGVSYILPGLHSYL